MSSAFSIDFLEPTSEFQTPNTKCGYSFSLLDRKKNLVIKLTGLAEIFAFSTPAPLASVLADIAFV